MHDVRVLLDPDNDAPARLARRGFSLDLPALRALVERRNSAADRIGELRARANLLARGNRGRGDPDDIARTRQEGRELKEHVQKLETEQRQVKEELTDLLMRVPNLPADEIPDGKTEADAKELYRVGRQRTFDFTPRHHDEIGEAAGIFEPKRAAKLSGARFRVARGTGAVLERALASFFLDLHTREHGYVEYAVPTLVTRETMTGTGQLPKFEEDLFHTRVGDRDLYLVPTAEVPLTNLYADEVIDARALPLALTAHTACFRAEAGSYGRDTRGILRLHEFSKVELVRICAPERSREELATMLSHAEDCLKRLDLAYRVVQLPAGDMGFAARMTFDIEVWFPGQDAYREISSCSDCGTFQSRRAGIWTRGDGGRSPVATLNGSGLPIGRTIAAILEQHQQADGSVVIPAALVPYTGTDRLLPKD